MDANAAFDAPQMAYKSIKTEREKEQKLDDDGIRVLHRNENVINSMFRTLILTPCRRRHIS